MSAAIPPRAAPTTTGERPRLRGPGTWDPRRSLVARFLWLLLPISLVPVSAYWFFADRVEKRSEQEVVGILIDQATERERARLRSEVEARVHELEDQAARVAQTLATATANTAIALRLPKEALPPSRPLEKLPEGVLRTRSGGVSAALVSRAGIGSAEALRELAATETLEKPFLAILAGQTDFVTLFVITRGGVLRAVPAGDIARWIRESSFPTDFRAPTRHVAPLLEPGIPLEGIVWTDFYPDLYGERGTLVTALRVIRGTDGGVVAQVGLDWAIERFLSGDDSAGVAPVVEILVPEGGKAPVVRPEKGLTEDEVAAIRSLVARGAEGVRELSAHGEQHLVAVRRLAGLPWSYARHASLSSVRAHAEEQARSIFEADRRRRNRLRVVYVGVVLALAALVFVVVRNAVEPIRRVARFADAITAGSEAPDLGSHDRLDEVGRLVTAMRNLDGRIRRRIATMARAHQLAGTASVMTSQEETFARLTRLVAEGIGAGKCWLALWEPETRTLAFVPPGHGLPDDALRGVRLGVTDRSLAVACYQTGETFVVNDALADPRLSLVSFEKLGIIRNVAFSALKTEAGILGVLAVADKPGGFDADDRAALESFADPAALLLRNARLYDELQRSYERLRDAQRNRDHLLQNVNHELRTPLTAILGWSEILSEDELDAETMRTAMDQIRRSAQFLLTLISDLLDLSRFEEGRTKLEPEEVDLAGVVADAVEPVSVMAEGKGIRISVSAPPRGEAVVRLDPVRVRQVLWNLLHNAVKFTPRGGQIELLARTTGSGVELTVSDTGVGVDPKDLPYIFERFRQADGGTTRAYRGMGIGLSLVKAFVELHGGTVTAESQPGHGTTFRVSLPKLPDPSAAA